MNLTEHFTLEEMISSPTASRMGFNEQQLPETDTVENLMNLCENILEPLRIAIGKPIMVSSGYRCKRLNKFIAGAKKSMHMLGQAADINEFTLGNKALFDKILELKLPFDCLINEFNYDWIHVSYNKNHNRGVILESYFEEGKVQYK
jgi:zinc D-Ala-D-Ala carboxypeptidase